MSMEEFPLHSAAKYSDLERMKHLLDHHGIPVDSRDCRQNTPLHYASTKEAAEILIHNKCDLDARNSEGETPLMHVLESCESPGHVVLLIESGADVNCRDFHNWNALHHACYWYCVLDDNDFLDVLRLLVSKVSDINVITTSGGSKTVGGDSALSLAAFTGRKYIVDLLMQSGAHVSCGRTFSFNLLDSAAFDGWTEIVKATVNEFDVNARIGDGYTALTLALSGCSTDVELIILLINNGAYVRHSDYAKIYNNTLCRERILKNTDLCSQILINNYDNMCLPTVYEIYTPVKKLPLRACLEIKNYPSMINEIKRSVGREIQMKTFCNVMEVRPLVLQMLAVRSLLTAHTL